MEEFLNKTHALRECYGNHTYSSLKNENKANLSNLCYNEKIELAKILQTINMKDNIKERLKILSENKVSESIARKEELDNTWK